MDMLELGLHLYVFSYSPPPKQVVDDRHGCSHGIEDVLEKLLEGSS